MRGTTLKEHHGDEHPRFHTKRGYYGVVIFQPKFEVNVGTLHRSAFNFGASFLVVIGRRHKAQSSDTVKSFKHIPLFEYPSWEAFKEGGVPKDCRLVSVEQWEQSKPLETFEHPERCIYVLGAEDDGLPGKILHDCHLSVEIDSPYCLNMSVAGSIVLYDRQTKSVVRT
jgi:tRNA G18 (ribose-2'-O)-methylase SpoU